MARMAVIVISCKKNECDKSGNITLEHQQVINEHLSILKGQGISNLIVVINKMDTAKWSQNRFETIKQSFVETLENNDIYPPSISFIPISCS